MGDKTQEKYWAYLNRLRKSGATNMYGAVPYLMDEFGVSREKGTEILSYWMKNYEEVKDVS